MKSRAHLKGHPIHPFLIPFPLAFFIGTLLFDILAYINDNPQLYTLALYMEAAGLVGGLLAAVPGIIDYVSVIPKNSSAKKRGARHGILNVTVVLLYGIALYYRLNAEDPNPMIFIVLEAIGTILLFISGWMGGTLVYRNQIGVDVRYANAGKWREEHFAEQQQVSMEDPGLQLNQMQLLHVGDKRIVLAKTEKGYAAFSDHCTHKGGSLAGGAMICGTVQCPWHGSQFDVQDGQVKAGPAKTGIATYPISVEGSKIVIDVRDR